MENAERKTVLESSIVYYVRQGYRVGYQTEFSAQLLKPKQFSLLLAIVLFLFYIIPFVIYLLYYAAQKDKSVYLVVDEEGIISATDENGFSSIKNDTKKPATPKVNESPSRKQTEYLEQPEEPTPQGAGHPPIPEGNKRVPVRYNFVPMENDPGYTTSTKIMVLILLIVFVVAVIMIFRIGT